MRVSVRSKIFLAFALVQIFSAAVIVGWYFYTINDELRSLNRAEVEEAVLETIATTKAYFGPPQATARIAQSLLAGGVLDRTRPDQLERYFLEELRLSPAVAGLFVGYPDGSFYYVSRSDEHAVGGTLTKVVAVEPAGRTVNFTWRDGDLKVVSSKSDPADDYDPRTRPWYQAAAERGDLIWTAPYVFFTARKPGITAALPVIGPDGSVAAIIGLDIELSAISRFLVQIGFRSSGSAYILSAEGDVIAHPNEKLVLAEDQQGGDALRFRKADELPGVDGVVGRLVLAETAPSTGAAMLAVVEQEFEGEDYFVASESMEQESWPWRVVAVVRAAGIERTLHSGSLLLVGVVLFTTGFACFAGWLIAGSVGRPLAELRRDAQHARQGNFELMSEDSAGIPEIDETRDALRTLAQQKRGLGPRS